MISLSRRLCLFRGVCCCALLTAALQPARADLYIAPQAPDSDLRQIAQDLTHAMASRPYELVRPGLGWRVFGAGGYERVRLANLPAWERSALPSAGSSFGGGAGNGMEVGGFEAEAMAPSGLGMGVQFYDSPAIFGMLGLDMRYAYDFESFSIGFRGDWASRTPGVNGSDSGSGPGLDYRYVTHGVDATLSKFFYLSDTVHVRPYYRYGRLYGRLNSSGSSLTSDAREQVAGFVLEFGRAWSGGDGGMPEVAYPCHFTLSLEAGRSDTKQSRVRLTATFDLDGVIH